MISNTKFLLLLVAILVVFSSINHTALANVGMDGIVLDFTEKPYSIEVNTKEYKVGNWDTESKTMVYALDLLIEDTKLKGVTKYADSCTSGSKHSTSCDIISILQNEYMIKQNDILIDQNRQILEELRK